MTPVKRVAAGAVAILLAAATATPLVVEFEGVEYRAYQDVVNVATVCAGSTKGIVSGKIYGDPECQSMTARDLVEHGAGIAQCLPASLPVKTRAAFTATAYNIGVRGFCGSSMARKANAGDLKGACDALMLWTKAGGKELRGLVRRRAAERELCLQGVAEGV